MYTLVGSIPTTKYPIVCRISPSFAAYYIKTPNCNLVSNFHHSHCTVHLTGADVTNKIVYL